MLEFLFINKLIIIKFLIRMYLLDEEVVFFYSLDSSNFIYIQPGMISNITFTIFLHNFLPENFFLLQRSSFEILLKFHNSCFSKEFLHFLLSAEFHRLVIFVKTIYIKFHNNPADERNQISFLENHFTRVSSLQFCVHCFYFGN